MGIHTVIALAIVIIVAAGAGAWVARRHAPTESPWPAMFLGGLLGAAAGTAVFGVLLAVSGLFFFFSGAPNPYVLMGLTLLVVLAASASAFERTA